MKLLVHAGLLVLAFGLGYLLRGPLPGSDPATANANAAGATASAGNSARSPQDATRDPKDPAVPFTGNAEELLAHLGSDSDKVENYAFLVRTLESASAEYLAALAAELASMSNNRDWVRQTLPILIKYWSKLDSPAVITWAKSLPKQKSAEALSSALSALAETDSTQALALVQSLPDERSRGQARTAIITAMAKKDPAAAFALIKPAARGSVSGV